MKITADTSVQDALKQSKNVQQVFKKYRLHCAACKGSKEDTIRIAAENNGLDLDAFLKELNRNTGE